MLERVWRKGDPPTLFMGLKIVTAIVKNSIDVPQNLKIELPYDPATLLTGTYPEKTIIQKRYMHTMFTAALLKIAKAWKQSKCPSAEELGKEDVVHTYGEILATRNETMPFAAT